MKITDCLRGEHGVLNGMFAFMEKAVTGRKSLEQLKAMVVLLERAIVEHATEEDDLLRALKDDPGAEGLVQVMHEEHKEIEGSLKKFGWADSLEEAEPHLFAALTVARDHFAKEEEALFPMAEQTLDPDVLEELGSVWARRRAVVLG